MESYRRGEVHGLEVAAMTANGDTTTGKLMDLTLEGAAVGFPRYEEPPLPVGSRSTLIFTAPWLQTPLQVGACATSRADNGELRNYHYQFEFESEEQRRRFSREAERVRDQRTANRVKPSTAEPVVVRVKLAGQEPSDSGSRADDFEVIGKLKNISTGGAAVLLERAAETVLAATDVTEVSFQLLQGSKTLQLRTWIRHRELRGDLMSYGLEFDTTHAEDFTQQLDEIVRYIAYRRREPTESG
jgi:PilZ domain